MEGRKSCARHTFPRLPAFSAEMGLSLMQALLAPQAPQLSPTSLPAHAWPCCSILLAAPTDHFPDTPRESREALFPPKCEHRARRVKGPPSNQPCLISYHSPCKTGRFVTILPSSCSIDIFQMSYEETESQGQRWPWAMGSRGCFGGGRSLPGPSRASCCSAHCWEI